MKLLVLDGNSIVNRAFFGIKLLTTKDGRYTNAIYGFLNILLSLLNQYSPDEVAIAWDLHAPTFRHKMYTEYKAGRHGMPTELAEQLPVLKDLLHDLGFVMVSLEGFEADDILGTLSAACEQREDTCFLATGDRDSLQLVSPHTTVLLASSRMGRSETIVMDEAAIQEKYGLSPAQLIDLKGLMGDSSDNLPGVPGVGEKTATKLLQALGSMDNLYAHLDDEAVRPLMRTRLEEGREKAYLSRTLGTIRRDVPIATEPGTYRRGVGDPAAAMAMLAKLEMHKMVDRWALTAPAKLQEAPQAPTLTVAPAALPSVLAGAVYLTQNGEQYAAVQGQAVYALDAAQLDTLLESEQAELWVFDAKPLYHRALDAGGLGRAIRFDAKLAAYLLNPLAHSYAVDELAAEHGLQPAFACTEFPLAGLAEPLYQALAQEVEEAQAASLLRDMEQPLALVLADMEKAGILVDADGLAQFGREVKAQLDESLGRIYEEVGYEFNLNSPKQLGEALFIKLGLPTRKKTKSGFSTDAATLESLRAYSPAVEDILQYRIYQKLHSTYAEGLQKALAEDGRIHTTFIQTETRTGRISSTEPNLQNIPIRTKLGSQLRQYFVAAPGCVLVDADYSQIELRVLAHLAGDEDMQQAFRSGQDIHTRTAAKIYNLPLEMVTPQLRARAKTINFGIMYGKGAYSLSQELGISVKEAGDFIKEYFAAFPRVQGYMDRTIADAKERGYVTTLLGRRRALPELASGNFNLRAQGERIARNTPIQGTAADIIKLAMVRVWQRLRAEQLQAKLILQVHDELLVEAPAAEADCVTALLREEMCAAGQFSVPLEVSVSQGRTWLEAH